MLTTQDQKENCNKLDKAIQKVLIEIDPNFETQVKDLKGILILRFPANHAKTGEVGITCFGQICFTHTAAVLADLYKMKKEAEDKLAE